MYIQRLKRERERERERERYVIYDPLDGRIHTLRSEDFEWKNSSNTLNSWCVTFDATEKEVESFIEKLESENQKMFHIVKGKEDEYNPIYDTVGFVKEHYLNGRCVVNEITDEQISIQDNKLFFGAIQVKSNDVVWIKIDPNQSERYFMTLRMMVPFERDGVVFINPPSVILSYDDKTIPLVTGDVINQRVRP